MTITPEYIVLTESPTMHLVCIRYADGLPWLRVVAVFPNKDRADLYAEFENSFVDDELPTLPEDLRYDHPDRPEPADGLARLLKHPGTPALEKPWVDVQTAPDRPSEVEEAPESLAPPGDVTPPVVDAVDPPNEPPRGDTKGQVRILWNAGRPVAEIADALDISEGRVYQIRKELNLPPRDPNAYARPGTKPKRAGPPTPKPAAVTPAPVAKPDAALPPKTNGASHPEYTRAGVTVTLAEGNEKIVFNGKSTPLTIGQSKLCAILLRAAPSPVGLKFIMSNLYGSHGEESENRLKNTIGALQGGILAPLGLDILEVKGIGYGLTGVE